MDLELGFNSEVLGREPAFLTHALGLANGTRLQFGAEGKRLVRSRDHGAADGQGAAGCGAALG